MSDLLLLHTETLYLFDQYGDMLTDNYPWPPGRRLTGRLHLGWNDSGVVMRFRHDVPDAVRNRVVAWVDSRMPCASAVPEPLIDLCAQFDAPIEDAGGGPVYTAFEPLDPETEVIKIDGTNQHVLPSDYLQEGEIDHVAPMFAALEGGCAVSMCATVRRTDRSIEAGVDTLEPHRGRGYAGQVTAAWINAAHESGLTPFYSTSRDNLASIRVAEKLGLEWIAWELSVK